MPLDASDRLRKVQETVLFTGYVKSNPNMNVSTCTNFYKTNVKNFNTYTYKSQIESGRIYFSTCLGSS